MYSAPETSSEIVNLAQQEDQGVKIMLLIPAISIVVSIAYARSPQWTGMCPVRPHGADFRNKRK